MWLQVLIGICCLTGFSVSAGCAGGTNLGTLMGSRDPVTPIGDSSGDFAQLPAGGFGTPVATGISNSSGETLQAGDTGFGSPAFAAGFVTSGDLSDASSMATKRQKRDSTKLQETRRAVPGAIPSTAGGLCAETISGFVIWQYLDTLSRRTMQPGGARSPTAGDTAEITAGEEVTQSTSYR